MFDIPIAFGGQTPQARSNLWNTPKSSDVQRNLIEGEYTDIYGNSTPSYQHGCANLSSKTSSWKDVQQKNNYSDCDLISLDPEFEKRSSQQQRARPQHSKMDQSGSHPARSRFHKLFQEEYKESPLEENHQTKSEEPPILNKHDSAPGVHHSRFQSFFQETYNGPSDAALKEAIMEQERRINKSITQYSSDESEPEIPDYSMEPKVVLLNPEDFTYGLGPEKPRKSKESKKSHSYKDPFQSPRSSEYDHIHQFWEGVFDKMEERAGDMYW